MATLLLIDPNPATRSILKSLLTDGGHRVEGIGSVIAARGVLARSAPDLILVDLGHQRATETLRGLTSLSVSPQSIALIALPDEVNAAGLADLAANYQIIDRSSPDDVLLAQIANRLGGGPVSSPMEGVQFTLPGPDRSEFPIDPGSTLDDVSSATRQDDLPAPESARTAETDDLESVYKDVGIDVPASKRTLLYCDLHRLGEVTSGLPAAEQDEVLATLLRKLEQAILSYDGKVCIASRNGFAVLFELGDGNTESDARPFQAGIEMVYIAQQFCGWLRHRYPGRGRQDFAISIALDTGAFDMEDAGEALDPELKVAITRAAHYATMGGQRGWTLTATREAMATAAQTCSAGESLVVVGAAGMRREIVEVGAVALDSTTSVHERVARMMQSNSALLRHGVTRAERTGIGAATRSGPSRGSASTLGDGNRQAGAQANANAEAHLQALSIGGGMNIPGYQDLRPLGKGGMAEVFLATHVASGEERVLKLLPINDGEEEQLQRFIQEYALISQIRDPNVARIYEQSFTQTHAYIAMEFLPGGELRASMKGPTSIGQTLAWIESIAGALMAVHAKGITHRDLKPANLMFRADGSLVLADFGIAKSQSDLLNRTANGHIVGSPYYLSPEQAESKPVDARCDLYSLGIILFEMLTGKKPFRASNLSDLIRQHVVAPIPRLPEELSGFQPLIDRMLAKLPSDRIGSAALVLDELRGLRARLTQPAHTPPARDSEEKSVAAEPLRDVYSVAVIGFDDTEKIVLSSTLGLSVRRRPRFIEFDSTRADRPDLYLVDARDLLYLQTMLASNLDRAVPTVLIGSSDFGTGWQVLRRPLHWTKVFEAFDRALREHQATRMAVAG